MIGEIDGTKIAVRGLVVGRIQRDLGAEIGGVDYAGVLLRRTQIAGILKGNSGIARLEQHGQHLASEVDGANFREHAQSVPARPCLSRHNVVPEGTIFRVGS